jgi:hypothetical protein
MKPNSFTFRIALLLLATPAWGQSLPVPAGDESPRPLNLSLPRDVLAHPPAFVRSETEDTATRNLRQEPAAGAKPAARHPYGTGYEARQRGTSSIGGAGGQAAGGGGGRGGMGRGR